MGRICLALLFVIIVSISAMAQPILQFSPDTLKFGYVSRGGNHERPLVLKNTGDQSLAIDSISLALSFTINPLQGVTLEPGDSLITVIGFAPTSEGNFSGVFGIYYNNPANPLVHIPIKARGIRAFAPGEAIWTYQHIEDVVCVAATEDYDGDGFPDIVSEAFDAGATGNNLVCFSGSGNATPNIIWSARPLGGPSNSGGWGDDCLKYVGDLNGDGVGDILLGTSWGSRSVFAIDGKTGQTIWSYDTYQHLPSGWIYAVAQTNDVTGDGVPDVLAGAGSDANVVLGLNGATGELIWQKAAEDAVMSVASLPDINGDGKDEAIFGAADNGTTAYCISGASRGNGSSLWSYDVTASTFSITSIGDLNNDGYGDAILGTWGSGYVLALNGHRSGSGQLLWRHTVGTAVMRVVAVPDLNGDGKEDVLVASWASYALALSGADGSELWRGNATDDVWAIDYTGDITGDGIPEVIYGSFNGKVYLVDGATGSNIWQFTCPYKIFTLRGIGDVNGDGFPDVIAGTQYLNNSGGKVYVISGGHPTTGITDNSISLPDKYMTVANYPNPFNNNTLFKFSLDKSSEYKLSIFDITGRIVKEISGNAVSGNNGINWNAGGNKGFSSGIYFYKLVAGTQTGRGKVTFLK